MRANEAITRRWIGRILAAATAACVIGPARAQVGTLAGPINSPTNGHDYYLLLSSTWLNAEATAIAMGGHLATINDVDENEWVRQNLGNYGGFARDIWIGFTDQASEGNFVWISGETANYTNWGGGEPNNANGIEHYAQMRPGSVGAWNDLANQPGYLVYGVIEVGGAPTPVNITTANPPLTNPYDATLPFRDVLQNTDAALIPQGVGVAGTPGEGAYTYAPFSVTFSGTPSPAPTTANITRACTDIAGDGQGDCPTVSSVSGAGAGPYLITLSGPIPARECITFTFAGTNAGQKLQYQSVPGDANMNGGTTGQDVIALVLAVNNGSAADPANLARYDMNRNGTVTGQDVLRLVQLINGGSTVSPSTGFNGATAAICP